LASAPRAFGEKKRKKKGETVKKVDMAEGKREEWRGDKGRSTLS